MITNMKKLLFIFLIFPFLVQAQVVAFKVEDGAGDVVRVLKPVGGKYFWANNAIDTLGADGQTVMELSDNHAGIYVFIHRGQTYRLYLRPEDEVHVLVNRQDSISPLVISGAQADGQMAFNRIESAFYQDKGMALSREYPVFEDAQRLIVEQITQGLVPFTQLLSKGRIDQGFYHAVEAAVKNYYASVLTVSLFDDLYHLAQTADSVGYDNTGKIDTVRNRWDVILGMVDIHDITQSVAPSFSEFHSLYDTWYLAFFDPATKIYRYKRSAEDDYWQAPYARIAQAFDGELREYLLASRIHFINAQQQFQAFQLDLFDDFTTTYPNSIYTPYLESGIASVVAYQEKVRVDFDDTYKFVSDYGNIQTFEELAQKFKDKVVYVDLWATWCGPCKAEFAHNGELKAFTEGKGIEVLYVSTDRDEAEQQWKDMIKFYDLKGHHVRASKSLSEDLRQHFSQDFGGQQGFAIPYYIILKDGEIVLKNALRPSAKTDLYQQLEGYL